MTRPARAEEDALTSRLRALGAEVLDFPATVIAPPASWAELDAALSQLGSFDWIAFASGNAVDALVDRCLALGIDPPAAGRVQLAAVGPATARRVAKRLRPADVVPAESRGEALAVALRSRVAGKRVLLPRAAEGRVELLDELAVAGASVTAAPAYRTRPVDPALLQPLADRLERGELDALLFTAPSAVKSVAVALGPRLPLLSRTVLAVIGPTTAAALQALGHAAAVQPRESSMAALAEALACHLGGTRP